MDIFKSNTWNKINNIIFQITLLLGVFAFGIKRNLIDVDLWARFIQGKYVVQNFHPMYQDTFSFMQTHTWYDPEWLSSAFIYLIAEKFHINGLVTLKCLLLFVFFSLLYTCAQKLNPESIYNKFIFILIPAICLKQFDFFDTTVRCHMITYILFIPWLFMLEKIRAGNKKFIYLMPLIMLFWLNTHGGCIAGMGVLLIYALGEFLNKKPFKKYLMLFIACALMFAINPWGLEYYKFIFDSIFVDRSNIQEWRNFFELKNFYQNFFLYYIITMVFSYAFQLFKTKQTFLKIDKTKCLLILVLAYLSISHIKHIPLCVIGFSLLLYNDFKNTFKIPLPKIETFYLKTIELCIYTIIAVLSLYSITRFYNLPLTHKLLLDSKPIIEMEFLKANNLKGKLFADYNINSYIAYKYGTHFKIFADGRYEQVYTKKSLKKLTDLIVQKTQKRTVLDILKEHQPDFVLFKNIPSIDEFLNSEYFLLYETSNYIIFAHNKYKDIETTDFYFYEIEQQYLRTLFKTDLDFSG